MMKSAFVWGLVVLVGLGGTFLFAFQDPVRPKQEAEVPKLTEERPMNFWMKKKLEFSKDILQALTSGDFETLEEKSRQMYFVGKLEGFARSGNARYTAQLQMFDMSTADLITQAQTRNIQGATLAFNHLTSSCVACHQDLRLGDQSK